MYIIIGAGIGGLATALALEKAGIDYQLYERSPEIRAVGAGIWLAPNALQALDWLGVLPQVKVRGWLIEKILLGEQDLTPITAIDLSPMRQQFGNSTVAIHRSQLQQIMLERLPAGKLQLGKCFDRYRVLPNQQIEVFFKDGSSVLTDYLLGADGIRSAVRKQLFPDAETRYTGQTCWRGVADIVLPDALESTGTELWGEGVRFGFSTIAKGKTYWFAVAERPAGGKDTTSDLRPQLTQMFATFAPVVGQVIQSTPPSAIIRNDLHDLKLLSRWHQGNICLLGDAGHATTPNMGQGGAQAIEDAYYMGKLLAGSSPESNVFTQLEALRMKKVQGVVRQSWLIGKMAHWKHGRWLRNSLLRHTPERISRKQMVSLYTIDAEV